MEIETHKFKSQDGVIDKEFSFDNLVYTNATEQYQIFGKTKDAFSYFKINSLVPYAEKLIELGKVPGMKNSDLTNNQQLTLDELIIMRTGGNDPKLRGTWLHPKLAIVFARWLSDEFAIWCDEKIADLLANGISTLQPEDRKWVDIIEDLSDNTEVNAWFISKVRDVLLLHEKQKYNIGAFDDLLEYLKEIVSKESHPKLFKNVRKLISSMYEAGELSRTSHEVMLERCVDRVVEVLEKKVRHVQRLVNKLEYKLSTTAISSVTQTLKAEHDNALKAESALVDAQSLSCHRMFGLKSIPQIEPLPVYRFGKNMVTTDCLAIIQEAGFKVAFANTMYKSAYNATTGSPDLRYRSAANNKSIAVWFKENNVASCSITTSYQDENKVWKYREILNIKLMSTPSVDPSFYTGTNESNTIRISLSTFSGYFMVYGRSSDKF